MTKRRCVILGAVGALFCGIFLAIGFLLPVRLSVRQVKDSVYAGETLTCEDFQVKTRTLFGISKDVEAYSLSASSGNTDVTVFYAYLSKTVHPDAVQAESLTAVYDGSLYVGQSAVEDCVKVTASYEDGTTGDVSDVWLSDAPVPNVAEHYELPVYTSIGTTHVEVPVIAPQSLNVSYTGSVMSGELFNRNRVCVMLEYPDGTSYRTGEFVLHTQNVLEDGVSYEQMRQLPQAQSVPMYLTSETELHVFTPYGNGVCRIVPSPAERLTGHYDGVVYEGDSLDDDKVSVTMQNGDVTVDVTEFRFVNPGPVYETTHVRIPTRYGTAVLLIEPVAVQTIEPVFQTTPVEGKKPDLEKLTLTYEDGRQQGLDLSEVEFLNLPDTWGVENKIWFFWGRKEYSFSVSAVPKEIVSMREDSYEAEQVYTVSEDVLSQLTRICQWRVGNDLEAIGMELSYMANCYEQSESIVTGDGADLLAYVLDSGNWGNRTAIESVIGMSEPDATAMAFAQDILQNGYRRLPLYVTYRMTVSAYERQMEPETSETGDSGIIVETEPEEETVSVDAMQKDQLITLPDGTKFYCYQVEADQIYGYTEDSYQSVTGRMPGESSGIQIEE